MVAEDDGYRPDDSSHDYYSEEPEPSLFERLRVRGRRVGRTVSVWFSKAEQSYLSLLRQTSLLAATLLLFGAILLFVGGLVLQFGNPDGIRPEEVSVATSDVVSVPESGPTRTAAKPTDTAPRWNRVLPAAFRERYYSLFRSSFAPYYRRADKAPDRNAFFAALFPDDRLNYIEAFDDARLADADQSTDSRPLLTSLQTIVAAAAAHPTSIRELKAYQAAKRVQVCDTVRRTRTRYETYWNSLATSCPYWYESPYGCSDTRAVSQPYTERVCRMEFPGEIANPHNVMLRLQDRYFAALDRKIQSADAMVDERRQAMMLRKANGSMAIETAVKAFLAFLGLMFIYILVAIERHHRVFTRMLAGRN